MASSASQSVESKTRSKTFTNWINSASGRKIIKSGSLYEEFENGVVLITLLHRLAPEKTVPGRYFSAPFSKSQKIQNLTVAFDFITEVENIPLTNIEPTDILARKRDSIDSLLLTLFLHYAIQHPISSSMTPEAFLSQHKDIFLSWINCVLPGIQVTNLHTDWRDGMVLAALSNYCFPNSIPKIASMQPENCNSNVRIAFNAAERFGIPQLLEVKDITVETPDEFSIFLYALKFVPHGKKVLLKWIRTQIMDCEDLLDSSSLDWDNGKLLGALVNAMSEGKFECYTEMDDANGIDNLEKSMEAAETILGIGRTITAAELADPATSQVSKLGYLSQFYSFKIRGGILSRSENAKAETKHSMPKPKKQKEINIPVGKGLKLKVKEQSKFQMEDVEIEVNGKETGPGDIELFKCSDGAFEIRFNPPQADDYVIAMKLNGEEMRLFHVHYFDLPQQTTPHALPTASSQCQPINLGSEDTTETEGDINDTDENTGLISTPKNIELVEQMENSEHFETTNGSTIERDVSALSKGIAELPETLHTHTETNTFNFVREGRKLSMSCDSITKLPETPVFHIEKPGKGELTAHCHGEKGTEIPVDIIEISPGSRKYKLKVKPKEPDIYYIKVKIDNKEIPSSPFVVDLRKTMKKKDSESPTQTATESRELLCDIPHHNSVDDLKNASKKHVIREVVDQTDITAGQLPYGDDVKMDADASIRLNEADSNLSQDEVAGDEEDELAEIDDEEPFSSNLEEEEEEEEEEVGDGEMRVTFTPSFSQDDEETSESDTSVVSQENSVTRGKMDGCFMEENGDSKVGEPVKRKLAGEVKKMGIEHEDIKSAGTNSNDAGYQDGNLNTITSHLDYGKSTSSNRRFSQDIKTTRMLSKYVRSSESYSELPSTGRSRNYASGNLRRFSVTSTSVSTSMNRTSQVTSTNIQVATQNTSESNSATNSLAISSSVASATSIAHSAETTNNNAESKSYSYTTSHRQTVLGPNIATHPPAARPNVAARSSKAISHPHVVETNGAASKMKVPFHPHPVQSKVKHSPAVKTQIAPCPSASEEEIILLPSTAEVDARPTAGKKITTHPSLPRPQTIETKVTPHPLAAEKKTAPHLPAADAKIVSRPPAVRPKAKPRSPAVETKVTSHSPAAETNITTHPHAVQPRVTPHPLVVEMEAACYPPVGETKVTSHSFAAETKVQPDPPSAETNYAHTVRPKVMPRPTKAAPHPSAAEMNVMPDPHSAETNQSPTVPPKVTPRPLAVKKKATSHPSAVETKVMSHHAVTETIVTSHLTAAETNVTPNSPVAKTKVAPHPHAAETDLTNNCHTVPPKVPPAAETVTDVTPTVPPKVPPHPAAAETDVTNHSPSVPPKVPPRSPTAETDVTSHCPTVPPKIPPCPKADITNHSLTVPPKHLPAAETDITPTVPPKVPLHPPVAETDITNHSRPSVPPKYPHAAETNVTNHSLTVPPKVPPRPPTPETKAIPHPLAVEMSHPAAIETSHPTAVKMKVAPQSPVAETKVTPHPPTAKSKKTPDAPNSFAVELNNANLSSTPHSQTSEQSPDIADPRPTPLSPAVSKPTASHMTLPLPPQPSTSPMVSSQSTSKQNSIQHPVASKVLQAKTDSTTLPVASPPSLPSKPSSHPPARSEHTIVRQEKYKEDVISEAVTVARGVQDKILSIANTSSNAPSGSNGRGIKVSSRTDLKISRKDEELYYDTGNNERIYSNQKSDNSGSADQNSVTFSDLAEIVALEGKTFKLRTLYSLTIGSKEEGALAMSCDPAGAADITTFFDHDRQVYICTILPKKPGNYSIVVKQNNDPITGSPFHVKFVDDQIFPNMTFSLGTGNGIEASNVTASMKNVANEKQIPTYVTQVDDTQFSLDFIASSKSKYILTIRCFVVTEQSTYLPSGCVGLGDVTEESPTTPMSPDVLIPTEGHTNFPASIEEGKLLQFSFKPTFPIFGKKMKVTASPETIMGSHQISRDGVHHCSVPMEQPGKYLVDARWEDKKVQGMPFEVSVFQSPKPEKVKVFGLGLSSGSVGRLQRFTIDTTGAGYGIVTAQVIGYDPIFDIHLERDPTCVGALSASYRPQAAGTYTLHVLFQDVPVAGSPFTVTIK